ncbi:helix-turn-helix domain-containing protein [Streptomyces europaeiscabiei]|uniref:helix-turn-helix domain-containing protein n=1 Tax=Streptomyces europaeiscabiei TaxID=146819 RepID=UPI0029AB04E5|nr:helix-turn-helix transcriptional regulator [Streptomyces europaeiscabiei]MDX2757325.1 helix-turn-helix transcriptional regulator [Streptomyces europaeiscabiei]
MPVEPTPRRRRLGAEIRRAREALGWTQEEAARQLGYKALSTVSKIEKGTQGVKIQQLPHFFEVLGVDDPAVREQWRELVRKAGEPDWWQRFEGVVNDPLGDYLSEIEEASSLFVWNPVVLHALLQTEEYERAVIEGGRAWKTAEEIDRFVAMRREHRLHMLDREPRLKVWAVLPEGLLRQEVGGSGVARGQVEHLIHLARTDPSVTIQVLPFSAGAHAGMDGPFMLMTFPTGRDTAVIEAIRALLHLNEPDTVEIYRTTSDHLKSDALSPNASMSLLNTIAKELAS